MHLGELELGNGPGTGREEGVADGVAQGLSVSNITNAMSVRLFWSPYYCKWGIAKAQVPLWLGLLKGLALGVVTKDPDVGEAPEVELLGTEHGHFGGFVG